MSERAAAPGETRRIRASAICDITALPADLPTDIDLISTVWAQHRLPTYEHLRRCLSEIARIRKATGCAVWIFDFARLHRQATFDAIVAMSPRAPQRLREDGIASERAAWSVRELRKALDGARLHYLQGGPERKIGSFAGILRACCWWPS